LERKGTPGRKIREVWKEEKRDLVRKERRVERNQGTSLERVDT
jgi:hypothetical protein